MSERINLGTFPVETAKEMAKIMRKMKKNEKVGTAKPINVCLRGRGPRLSAGADQRGISLEKATGAAVYIDVEITDRETLRQLLIARDEIQKKETVIRIERESAGLDERELKIVQDNLVSRMIADRSEIEEMLKFGFVGVMNVNGRELLGMLLDKLEIENLNRKRA
jgi:hypothetical protein